MFANLNTFVNNLSTEASHIAATMKAKLEQEKLDFMRDEEIYGKGVSIDTSTAAPIWEKDPPGWDGHRKLEWRMLVTVLPEDEHTFLVGAGRGLADSECEQLKACGLSLNPILEQPLDSLMPCAQLSMVKGGALDEARFHLVPSKVKEPEFWKNFFWKCQELGKCSSIDQVHTLLLIINCPLPKRAVDDAANGPQKSLQEAKVKEMLTPIFEVEKARKWLEEQTPQLEEEMRNAQESIQLLQDVLSQDAHSGDPDEVTESMFNSCKYRKQKISRLIGDLDEHCPLHCEDMQTKLMALNDALKDVLAQYRRQFPLDDDNGADIPTSQQPAAASTTCQTSVPVDIDDDDDDDFDTKMPWEE